MMLANCGTGPVRVPKPSFVRHMDCKCWKLVVLTALAVLCVFFVHVHVGPWSAVNGPATAFEAARYALLVVLLIVLATSSKSQTLLRSILVSSASVHAAPEPGGLALMARLGATPIRC